MKSTAPRIYCIPAINAPTVAVFRRGPSDWSHIGCWDIAQWRYTPGAWLKGRVFPRCSDLSPDGRLLCYFAHQPGATWEYGEAYITLSRLPWFTALHAFPSCGTWARGFSFTEDKRAGLVEAAALPMRYGLRATPLIQFAIERARGWSETAESDPRDPKDIWDQHRNARMHKIQPGGKRVLRLESIGWAGGEFNTGQSIDGMHVSYALESGDTVERLNHLQWADWDHTGNLLTATRKGKLQAWALSQHTPKLRFEADLTVLKPTPTPAPAWASQW